MKMEKGQIIEGTVINIKPYGVFVKMDNGQVGLAFIEDLSVVRIKSPEERLNIGQKIKCMIKSIDKETGKINLSYKDCLGTWEENIENFKEGMTVKGIVRDKEKNKNGVFIELTPNLVGMTEYTEELQYGQPIDVCIKKIVPEKKKVKLIIV
ncbi:MAG: S1 RNA-binding domain-containing protein [Clostridia bacterium]|nr:S1 RNA-binding domain-containing protein [Clostridia bacterium]